jgi:hypothetical protein
MIALLVFLEALLLVPDPIGEEQVDNIVGRLHCSGYSLALRTKYIYAPTFTKLITIPIMFQTTTGRETINKP